MITDIQRFSVHDGPGIRTTFFLKGCLLRCPWCSNPETQTCEPEVFFLEEKCLLEKRINCSFCNSKNLQDLHLKVLNNFSAFEVSKMQCPTKALGVYGFELKIEDFIKLIKKDYEYFINSGGGITFSGGEPLLQEIVPFIEAGKNLGIHTTLESSLFAPIDSLRRVMGFVDLFIIDVKILSSDECKKAIGGDLNVYLQNIELLSKEKKKEKILVRFPIVKDYTYTERNLKLFIDFVKSFDLSQIEIFSVHNLGKIKYKSLGKEPHSFAIVSDGELEKLSKLIERETESNVRVLKY